jgi:hypothetical protein
VFLFSPDWFGFGFQLFKLGGGHPSEALQHTRFLFSLGIADDPIGLYL